MLPRSCRTLRIDINSGKVRKSIAICQNDSIFPTLNFQLVEDGKALDISDVLWAEIFIHKTDGYEVDNGCVIDGDSIQYPLHSSDVSALGTNLAQLQLTFKDASVITTPTFEIEVYSKILDQRNQQSTNDYTSLSQMLVRATAAVSEAEESASEADSSANLASEYADDAGANALYAAGAASDAADTIGLISSMATLASENAAGAASDYASTSEMYSQVVIFGSEAYENATAASNYAQSASEYASVAASETSNAALYSSQASSDAEATSEYASTASSEASEAESFMDSCSMYADAAAQSAASADLQLGETSTTAYRGDKGKAAYDHAQIVSGNPHGTTYADVGADAAGSAASAAASALAHAMDYADGLNNSTVKTKGRIAFASLPSLLNVKEGDMYNITDAFTSDSRFIDGSGKQYGAGSNVYAIAGAPNIGHITTGSEGSESYLDYTITNSGVILDGEVAEYSLLPIATATLEAGKSYQLQESSHTVNDWSLELSFGAIKLYIKEAGSLSNIGSMYLVSPTDASVEDVNLTISAADNDRDVEIGFIFTGSATYSNATYNIGLKEYTEDNTVDIYEYILALAWDVLAANATEIEELADIQDVDIDTTNLSDGDVVTYDQTSGKWKNKPASGGGIVPDSLTVTSQPTKTVYFQGDELDLTGLAVSATILGNITGDVTSHITTSMEDGTVLDTTGVHTITISYAGATTTLTVNVYAISGIAVTTQPTKTSFKTDEALDYSGIVVTATAGTLTKDVTSDCTFSPAAGTIHSTEETITVTATYVSDYGTFTTTFSIEIKNLPASLEDATWAEIKQASSDGTLSQFASVGDTKTITVSGNTVTMQLARINDGTGTAGTYYPAGTADFISVETLPDRVAMNSSNTNVGGWNDCAMRTYLNNTLYATLPSDLKAVIVEKTHMRTAGNGSTNYVSASDKLWLPTEWEMFGSATYGGESATYNEHYAIFPDAESRKKTRIGQSAPDGWWESSPYVGNTDFFCCVGSTGSAYYGNASTTRSVALCLRIG